MFIVVSCSSNPVNTLVPTQTLIPPTPTATFTPIVPTTTPQNLPIPQDFSLTPSPTPLSPLIESAVKSAESIAQEIATDLARNIGVSAEQLIFLEINPRLYFSEVCTTTSQLIPTPLSHGYKLVWTDGVDIFTYLVWGDDKYVWCQVEPLTGKYLIAIDPVAEELVALAKRRILQQTNAEPDEVQLEDVFAVEWQDTSLGCPIEGQTYTSATIDGYRIVIRTEETSYLFHTDSVQLVPCEVND